MKVPAGSTEFIPWKDAADEIVGMMKKVRQESSEGVNFDLDFSAVCNFFAKFFAFISFEKCSISAKCFNIWVSIQISQKIKYQIILIFLS